MSRAEDRARLPDDDACTPLYDPKRDGAPRYADPYAAMLGDPPVGRREMLAKHVPTAGYSLDEEYAGGQQRPWGSIFASGPKRIKRYDQSDI